MTTAVVPKTQGMPFEAIVIRSKTGVIKNIKSQVSLSVEDGTLVKMGTMTEKVKGPDGSEVERPVFMVTATGAREAAQMSGVMALQPKSIIVNGTDQPNNYQDPHTGKVYSECVAIGYSKLGQLTAVKRMMIYDADLANIQDLIAKASAKWNKEWFKMAPTKRDKEGNLVPPSGCDEMWAGYPVDQAMTIWVNCSAPDIMKWQREMVNKRDKAIRTCQTFAERNALFAHPNMPKRKKFYAPKATVTCHTWFAESGQLRFDLSKLEIDGDKLLAAAPVVDEKTVDLNEEIDREERLAADEVVDETDIIETEEQPAAQEPQKASREPGEDNDDDDNLPLGEGPEKKAIEKKQAEAGKKNGTETEARNAVISDIRTLLMSGKINKAMESKANKAVGWDPNKAKLEELDTESLISLRSLYRAAK